MPNWAGGPTGTIGAGLSGWGSSLYDWANNIPSSYPSTGGGSYANPIVPAIPTDAPTDSGSGAFAPPTVPSLNPSFGAPSMGTPAAGGINMSAPASSSDPAYPGGAYSEPAAPAADPYGGFLGGLWKVLGGGKSAPAAGSGTSGTGQEQGQSMWPLILGILGTGTTDILKYVQQRKLLNDLGGQATALNKKMNPALIRNITGPVKATLQETGNINSPYLTSQAVATAAAPYAFDQNLADLQAVLEANRIAMGLYPDFDLAGFVQPGVFGGGGGGRGYA